MVKQRLCRMFFAAALWGVAATASAQQVGSISGVVYDSDFEAPVANATVNIAGTERQVQTGPQGNYTLGDIEPGTYTLVINKPGYSRRVITDVPVSPGQVIERDVWLSGEFTDMNEFVVQDVRIGGPTEVGLLELRAVSPQFLDSIGSDFLSRAGASDAAAGLRLVSGATTTKGNFAAVRGLPPRFVSTQLNGFMLPSADPDTRAVQLDLFPSEVIESIQVSKTFTPDQQGMASGGAVNIITKSIPERNFIKFSSKYEVNTQRPGGGEFLLDDRGGVRYFGMDGSRELDGTLKGLDGVSPGQMPDIPLDSNGNLGPRMGDAPIQYDWSVTGGVRGELFEGFSVGGLATFFWAQDVSHHDNGINDQLVRSNLLPGTGLAPAVTGNSALGFFQTPDPGGQVLTNLFDETQSEHEITWGGLGTFGLKSEDHEVSVTFMHTRVTTSSATIGEDTRGKFLKFPGHDPTQVVTPGGADHNGTGDDLRNFAPFRRLETQEYVERTVQSLQFSGRHAAPFFKDGAGLEGILEVLAPAFDWNVASSFSRREEPGTRIFDSKFLSAAEIGPFVSGEQNTVTFDVASLGPYNVVYRDIEEDSTQYRLNLELPFRQWTGDEGFIKVGLFDDETERTFTKDTFALLNNSGIRLFADFDEARLSDAISNPEDYPLDTSSPPDLSGLTYSNLGNLSATPVDFQYTGKQAIDAWYWMVDLPITSFFEVVGGVRYEQTRLSTKVAPDTNTTDILLDGEVLEQIGGTPGIPVNLAFVESALGVGGIDANLEQRDILPSLGAILKPWDSLTLRAAYSETIARPTFRELTPVSQALFGGETPFVGNPFLVMSSVKNYDLRLDYRPFPDSLLSISYFKKDVDQPIQVVQQAQGQSNIIIPVNFPKGRIKGWEFEVRQNLGRFFEPLQGVTIGGNATLLDTEVELREFERDQLAAADVPIATIPMTNAPDYLYNLFMTLDVPETGSQLSLFYTVRGDTLIASPGTSKVVGNEAQFFVPGVYEKEFDTLNLTLSQKIGDNISLKFSAKNLTNSKRQTVYRSEFVDGEAVKTSHTEGIDFSVSISANFEF